MNYHTTKKVTLKPVGKVNSTFVRTGIAFYKFSIRSTHFLSFHKTYTVYQLTKLTKQKKTTKKNRHTRTHAHIKHIDIVYQQIFYEWREIISLFTCFTGPSVIIDSQLFLLLVSSLSPVTLVYFCVFFSLVGLFIISSSLPLFRTASFLAFSLAQDRLEIAEIGSTFENVYK